MVGVLMPVSGRMAVRGTVAAANVSTRHAEPKVYPFPSDPDAVLTSPA